MSRLFEVAYISTAVAPFHPRDLQGLLRGARTHNRALGVTGLLLHAEGTFLQVLEGEQATVTELFDRIASDPRHREVARIVRRPLAERGFGDWSMGFVEATGTGEEELDSFRRFVASPEAVIRSDLLSLRVRELLTAFRNGRFRQHVNVGPALSASAP